MGQRTLKRVPMDFDAPLNEVWKGYVNPYPGPLRCKRCDATGYNRATRKIADDFYDFNGYGTKWCSNITQDEVQALIDRGRLWDFVRVPINDEQREVVNKKGGYWLPYNNGYTPTAEEVNKWNKNGMGHDAINRGILIETRAKRLGIYGLCPTCNGYGEIPYPDGIVRKAYDEWESYEPPDGKGYQLWETTSEGSPVSPVFSSAEELANWCEDNATVFGGSKTTKDRWLKMFSEQGGTDAGSFLIATSGGYIGSAINKGETNHATLRGSCCI